MGKLHNDRYEEIKEIITALYERLHIAIIPIDCFAIAESLGFAVIPYSKLAKNVLDMIRNSGGGDAYTLVTNNDRKYIFYNDDAIHGRIRFTIMHEIGHDVLGHLEESDLANSEADYFAKYALAPMPLVHAHEIDTYVDIMNIFKVSGECASNIMDSYLKWLRYGPKNYTNYENRLVELFRFAS